MDGGGPVDALYIVVLAVLYAVTHALVSLLDRLVRKP